MDKGKRNAENLHAAFEEAGDGNVNKGAGLKTALKETENTLVPLKIRRATFTLKEVYLNAYEMIAEEIEGALELLPLL